MYIRVTMQRVRPEQRDLYKRTWEEQAIGVHTLEPGNAHYLFMQDAANENQFIFVAIFKDRAAQQQHLEMPHFKKCKEILKANHIEPENLTIWEASNISPDDAALWRAKAQSLA